MIKDGHAVEIMNLFYGSFLNIEQIDKIRTLVEVIGKYMFLDRAMIEERAGEKIGLSYIKKAVKYNILTEIKFTNDKVTKDEYFYQLGNGGYTLLRSAERSYNRMNVLTNKEEKEKILTMNQYILENDIDLMISPLHDAKCNFFMCDQERIVYISDYISEKEIARYLVSILVKEKIEGVLVRYTMSEIQEMFEFCGVKKGDYDIGIKSKRSDGIDE